MCGCIQRNVWKATNRRLSNIEIVRRIEGIKINEVGLISRNDRLYFYVSKQMKGNITLKVIHKDRHK